MFDTTNPRYLLREASSHDAMISPVTTLKPTSREGPGRECDVGGIAPGGHQDAPDARRVMAGIDFQLPISSWFVRFPVDPGESTVIPCLAPINEQVRTWDLGSMRRRRLVVWETCG